MNKSLVTIITGGMVGTGLAIGTLLAIHEITGVYFDSVPLGMAVGIISSSAGMYGALRLGHRDDK